MGVSILNLPTPFATVSVHSVAFLLLYIRSYVPGRCEAGIQAAGRRPSVAVLIVSRAEGRDDDATGVAAVGWGLGSVIIPFSYTSHGLPVPSFSHGTLLGAVLMRWHSRVVSGMLETCLTLSTVAVKTTTRAEVA